MHHFCVIFYVFDTERENSNSKTLFYKDCREREGEKFNASARKSCDREMMGRIEQKRRRTSISLLALRADDVTVGQLYAWPVVGAGAGLTVIRRSLCGVAIEATCAVLTVVTFRVVLTDAAA